MGSVDPVLSIGSTARFTVNSASSPVIRGGHLFPCEFYRNRYGWRLKESLQVPKVI